MEDALADRICQLFMELVFYRAYPHIPSKTLQEAMTINGPVNGSGFLEIPHYWAQYVHDGRGGMIKDYGERPSVFIWFRNIADDPRIAPGQTPERVDQLRHLSQAEMTYWIARCYQARKAGLPEPMVVRRVVGQGVDGAFFFDNDRVLAGIMEDFDRIAEEQLRAYLRQKMPQAFEYVTAPPAVGIIG
jgi:hypothetical protein